MEEVLQSKAVQEIALSCNGEIPEQFIHKDGFPHSKVDSVSYMDDFVIDFSLVFSSSSSPETDHELGKLRSALSQWGVFQILDWMDRLYFTVNPEDQRKLKPVAFREIIHEYTLKLRLIFDLLMKAMARSLNLEGNRFLKGHGDMVAVFARFNFYPPCPTPESVFGIKPHADGVTVTMLLQDKEVEGLQVLKDDHWFKVPIVPDIYQCW